MFAVNWSSMHATAWKSVMLTRAMYHISAWYPNMACCEYTCSVPACIIWFTYPDQLSCVRMPCNLATLADEPWASLSCESFSDVMTATSVAQKPLSTSKWTWNVCKWQSAHTSFFVLRQSRKNAYLRDTLSTMIEYVYPLCHLTEKPCCLAIHMLMHSSFPNIFSAACGVLKTKWSFPILSTLCQPLYLCRFWPGDTFAGSDLAT